MKVLLSQFKVTNSERVTCPKSQSSQIKGLLYLLLLNTKIVPYHQYALAINCAVNDCLLRNDQLCNKYVTNV